MTGPGTQVSDPLLHGLPVHMMATFLRSARRGKAKISAMRHGEL
jgi:hypothetical protein